MQVGADIDELLRCDIAVRDPAGNHVRIEQG
jgi:hypothetical protein